MICAERETVGDHQHLGLLKEVSFQPIFIMGDHRSGTTLLYQLLDATQRFNVVRAYHIIKYDEVLTNYLDQQEESAKKQLGELFNEIGVTDRLLDGVRVTPDLPEEYGFLLGQDFRPKLNPQNLSRLTELCRKIQFVSDPNRPLLLKNPWDFMNFMYVKEAFPEAKFIFLHRNPINLINSQIKAARVLYESKSPYHSLLDSSYQQLWGRPFRLYMIRLLFSSHLDLGFRVATRHVARTTRYFLDHVRLLADRDYLSVRFEDLCQDPQAIVTKILNFLGIGENAAVGYGDFIQTRQARLLDEVQRNKTAILKRHCPYFVYCTYEFDGALQ